MFVFIILVWMIFNGNINLEIICFGAVISTAVCLFLSRFTDYSIKLEVKIFRKLPFILAYVFLLLVEVIKANIVCSKLIFKGEGKIEPALVSFPSPLKSRLLSTVLANSITLTPGTISVSLKNERFVVHCLDKSLYKGITDSSFVRLLKRIEG